MRYQCCLPDTLLTLMSANTSWAADNSSKKAVATKPATATTIRTLTWDDLLPDAERNAPPTNRSPVSIKMFGDVDEMAMEQYGSTAVNPKFSGQQVRIPGFLVPLDMMGNKIRSFFLVPYYGACIHVPPPPPNQMVYVELATPISSSTMYEAQWITGTLTTQRKSNRLASASYTIKATSVQAYREP